MLTNHMIFALHREQDGLISDLATTTVHDSVIADQIVSTDLLMQSLHLPKICQGAIFMKSINLLVLFIPKKKPS